MTDACNHRLVQFVFTFTICLVFIYLESTCAGETPVESFPEKQLLVCLSASVESLDPTNYRGRDTQMVIKNIFDSLTTRDLNMKVVPQLAESWRAINTTTWEFSLRKGIRFHNGDVFTAKDVHYTLERVTGEGGIDGKTSPRKTLMGPISGVKIVDNHTVRIMTEKPWPVLPLMLTLQEIVPSDYMSVVGSEKFENAPIGTGPFRFVEKQKDGTLVLSQFKEYYGGAPANSPVQTAPLSTLIFKTAPEAATRIAMLKRGDADIVTNVPPESLPLFHMDPKIKALSQPATRSYFAEINCEKAPFNDLRVRLAMNYAMDMKMIVGRVLQGRGQVLPTVLLPEAVAYNRTLAPYPYFPEKSKKLLREAAFPKGYTVKIYCMKKYELFANTISLFLSRIGIRSMVATGEKKQVRAAMKNRSGDILVSSWGNTTLDPVGIILPKFKYGGRGNFSNYRNEKVETLLVTAEKTVDLKKREECYRAVQEVVYKDAPMIFGYAAEEFYGIRSHVRGFVPSPSGMLNLHDVSIE